MVMARVLAVRAGRRHAHVAQTEIELQLGGNGGPVLEIDEIDLGPRTGLRGATGTLSLRQRHAIQCDADDRQCEDQNCAPPGTRPDVLEHVNGYSFRGSRRLFWETVDLNPLTGR